MNKDKKQSWTRFFFESNQFFDNIENLTDWQRLRDAYPELSDEKILAAKEATYRGTLSLSDRAKRPNFGFRREHDGEKTLGDFFVENGMTIPAKISTEQALKGYDYLRANSKRLKREEEKYD